MKIWGTMNLLKCILLWKRQKKLTYLLTFWFKSKKMEYSPRSGSELQQIISDMAKAPKSAVDRYNALVTARGG